MKSSPLPARPRFRPGRLLSGTALALLCSLPTLALGFALGQQVTRQAQVRHPQARERQLQSVTAPAPAPLRASAAPGRVDGTFGKPFAASKARRSGLARNSNLTSETPKVRIQTIQVPTLEGDRNVIVTIRLEEPGTL